MKFELGIEAWSDPIADSPGPRFLGDKTIMSDLRAKADG